jgi:uncharacterized protein involved in response to NO
MGRAKGLLPLETGSRASPPVFGDASDSKRRIALQKMRFSRTICAGRLRAAIPEHRRRIRRALRQLDNMSLACWLVTLGEAIARSAWRADCFAGSMQTSAVPSRQPIPLAELGNELSRTSVQQRIRDEPFRVFFPLAFLLGIGGVAHWVLLSAGALGRYLAGFHAVTQMQSFMLAFASGFLFTAIPKRTRSGPASWLEIGLLIGLLPTVSLAALFGATVVSQLSYAGALLVLVQFAGRRFATRASGRRPPASFVLVPLGLMAGFAGAVMLLASDVLPSADWVYPFGRALVSEGAFLCLTLGIGPFFLAVALHGEAPSDISRRSAAWVAGYAAAGVVILVALALHAAGFVRPALLLRGAVVIAVLAAGRAWRLPSRPGRNRQLLWLATWMVPLGLMSAAAFPQHRVAAMHVTYIGGFGLLAFAVATHVTLGHSGYDKDQAGRPRAVVGFGALFAAAMLIRSVGTVLSSKYFEVLGLAAAMWLLGAIVWASYLLPKMWRAPLRDISFASR